MKNKKMYLTTGEFAKLCNVSKHTLYHYNDIDVFVPQYIDENGYRYYHVLQYDTFCTITQLRTVGMPLSEIKTYLSHRSPQKLISLCSEQESLIDIQIKQLRQIKENLRATRKDVEQALIPDNKIFIRKEFQEYLRLSEILEEADDSEMTLTFGILMNSVNGAMFRPVSGMIHRTCDLIQGNYNQYCRFYLRTSCNKNNCDCIIKPAGQYLVIYHYGGYETLGSTYQELLSYADKNSIILGEWFYEEMVIGDWAVMDTEGYVVKVSVQII